MKLKLRIMAVESKKQMEKNGWKRRRKKAQAYDVSTVSHQYWQEKQGNAFKQQSCCKAMTSQSNEFSKVFVKCQLEVTLAVSRSIRPLEQWKNSITQKNKWQQPIGVKQCRKGKMQERRGQKGQQQAAKAFLEKKLKKGSEEIFR